MSHENCILALFLILLVVLSALGVLCAERIVSLENEVHTELTSIKASLAKEKAVQPVIEPYSLERQDNK